MLSVLEQPAFWGFCAASIRAGFVAFGALWNADPPPDKRRRKFILSQLALSAMLGPLVAAGLEPSLAHGVGRKLDYRALSLFLGFAAGYAPMLADKLVRSKGFVASVLRFALSSMGSEAK
jgi:hypothetical protein